VETVKKLLMPSVFVRVNSCDFVECPLLQSVRSTKSHELVEGWFKLLSKEQ